MPRIGARADEVIAAEIEDVAQRLERTRIAIHQLGRRDAFVGGRAGILQAVFVAVVT